MSHGTVNKIHSYKRQEYAHYTGLVLNNTLVHSPATTHATNHFISVTSYWIGDGITQYHSHIHSHFGVWELKLRACTSIWLVRDEPKRNISKKKSSQMAEEQKRSAGPKQRQTIGVQEVQNKLHTRRGFAAVSYFIFSTSASVCVIGCCIVL